MSNIDTSVLDQYREVMGEDADEFIRDIVQTFMDSSSSMAQVLKNALASKDAEVFHRTAHSMKSNLATMGAQALSEKFKQLEYSTADGDLEKEGLPAQTQATLAELKEVRERLRELYL